MYCWENTSDMRVYCAFAVLMPFSRSLLSDVQRCTLLCHVRAEANVTLLGQAVGMVLPARSPSANTAYSTEGNYQHKQASADRKGIPNEEE